MHIYMFSIVFGLVISMYILTFLICIILVSCILCGTPYPLEEKKNIVDTDKEFLVEEEEV